MANSIQVRFWKDWCERHNTDLINYFPYFEGKNALAAYFIRKDEHWNKKGHRLVADAFLAFFKNREDSEEK